MSEMIFSKEPINYSPDDWNNIASIVLSDLTDSGEITFTEGIRMKEFFNTVMEMAACHRNDCDEIIKQVHEWEKEHMPAATEDWDVLKAAQAVTENTVS